MWCSSVVGAVRTGSYMFHVLTSGGFKRSICDQSFYNGPVSKFWAYAFVLSKAPELGQSSSAGSLLFLLLLSSFYCIHFFLLQLLLLHRPPLFFF